MSQLNLGEAAPTLSQAYAAAQRNLRALSSSPPNSDPSTLPALYTRTLDSLHLLLSLQSSFISSSDFLSELPTSTLRLLLTPFHLAQTLLNFPGIDGRLPRVRQSITSHLAFLSLLDHLDGLIKAEERRFQTVQQSLTDPPADDAAAPPRPRVDPGQARQEKIARYKEQKAIEAQLTAYEARQAQLHPTASSPDDDADASLDEDDAARDYWTLRIRFSVTKALDDLVVSQQELALLQHRNQQASLPPPSPAPDPPAPIIHRISSPADLALPFPPSLAQWLHPLPAARLGRAEVFRDPNPATMSIEEWAEGEMRAGRLPGGGGGGGAGAVGRAERTREERGYVAKAGGQDEEQRNGQGEDEGKGEWGGEEEESKSDAKTKESREWDNWKDDHEKGAGNRMARR